MKFSALVFIALTLGFSFFTKAEAQVYPYHTNARPLRRVVYGAAYRNEVGASASLGKITSANSTTVINLASSYKKLVTHNGAFGAVFELSSVNGNGQNSTYFGLWGTYTYFFDTNWNTNNSFFAEAGIGMADTGLANQNHSTVMKSERQLAWFALIGKNFPIFDKVRFSPKAGVEKIGSTDLAVVLIPLNLTLAF
jgi:hypothetical protein